MNRFRIVAAIAVGALIASSGCGTGQGGSSADSNTLTVTSWGGVWTDNEQKYFFKPFEKDTGIHVKVVVNGSSPMTPALLQEQQNDVSIDLVETENSFVLKDKGYLGPFSSSLMKLFAKKFRPDSYTQWVVNSGQTASLIVCNPKIMKKCPTTPKEFFDTKNYPGPRAIVNEGDNAMALALQADGVSSSELSKRLDIPRAMRKLRSFKQHVQVWPSSGSEQQQILINGEVGAAYMWNGRAYVVKRDNIPGLQMSWTGSTIENGDGYAILKNGPNKKNAEKFLTWLANHPKNQAKWSQALTYPTPTKELDALLPKDIAAALPVGHHPVMLNSGWGAKHQDEIQQNWQQFLGG